MITLIFIYLAGSFIVWDFAWVLIIGTFKPEERLLLIFAWILFTVVEAVTWINYLPIKIRTKHD